MKTLLKGGRVIDPATQTDAVMDVLIEDERIKAVDLSIPISDADVVITLSDKVWVTPGLVDIHVHFRDPGQLHKETTASGAASALAGGFTSVCIMPNTSPVIDDLPTLHYVNNAAKETDVNIYVVAAATKELKCNELTEMGSLKEHGVVGFTDDGLPIHNSKMMRLALEYAAMLDVPIFCHEEDLELSDGGCMNEGYYSTLLGLPGVPNTSESVMVARDLELARSTGGHVHLTHISTKECVALIRQAKAEGIKVTSDTTPHHLALTDAVIQDYDADFKMNPPLRAEADQQALINGIMDGTIDAIATDHAPHSLDEKTQAFDQAPNGVVGLETALGVILTNFFHTGKLTPTQIIQLMSTGPAKVMKLPAGQLAPGEAADITVIDPESEWVVDPSLFKSKSRNSPFKGMTLKGKAIRVFSAGKSVVPASTVPDVISIM